MAAGVVTMLQHMEPTQQQSHQENPDDESITMRMWVEQQHAKQP